MFSYYNLRGLKTLITEKGLIDCDVHNFLDPLDELVPYLDEPWQKMMNIGKFKRNDTNIGFFTFPSVRYPHPNHVLRLDSIPPNGRMPGSDPAFLLKDLFDRFNTTYGILNVGHGSMSAHHNIDLAIAYSTACNDWLLDKWIQTDERFRMSMIVAPLDPQATVKEIERIGHHPGVVAINLQNVNIPMGHRHFWPIYEIAEQYDLPILLHPDAEGSGEYSAPQFIGPASTYFEWHSALSMVAQRQIISLVAEGVFERFPKLKVAFIEYGFAWIGSVMWRMDKDWKALRDEAPWLKNLPSEYIRRNIRLGTQPMEETFRPKGIVELIQMMKAEDMLLFCSDYPHWDGEFDDRILAHFPKELKEKILFENAFETFRFKTKVAGGRDLIWKQR
jgi:predicted TIM-barrel fold metal-dependent hydrolase